MSYSQYNSYVECPRSWYLSKVVKAPERPTWYMLIGTVVHKAVEFEIAGLSYDIEQIFYEEVLKQRKVEPDVDQWLAGGSPSDPVVRAKALALAKDCVHNALEYLENFTVWEVEYDASGTLPGLEVPIKAFVDVIGEHKKHGPSIVDWKTGASKPKGIFQLETYRALLVSTGYDKELNKGHWAMLAPKASKARPVDLSKVDPAEVGAKYQKVYDQMKSKLYKANVRFACKFCFNQDNCLDKAGHTERANYYDQSGTDGIPF